MQISGWPLGKVRLQSMIFVVLKEAGSGSAVASLEMTVYERVCY